MASSSSQLISLGRLRVGTEGKFIAVCKADESDEKIVGFAHEPAETPLLNGEADRLFEQYCRELEAIGVTYVWHTLVQGERSAHLISNKNWAHRYLEGDYAKIDALDELIEGLNGKPCIVGYHFNHDLKRLQKYLPSAPYIGSGIGPKEMQKVIDKWNAGDIPVLFAHPQSAGHGLNLQGSGHAVIWFSNTWSLEIYDQFIRRLWRQGQRNNIVVHQIIARDTIDEAIVSAINSKDKTQQALMNAVRDYSQKVKEREEIN